MHVLVLMSTYNGEEYLQTQIESIIRQKDVNVQLLVRDDGSKDKTVDLLHYLSTKYPNIKYYRAANVGFIKSFNELVINAINIEPKADYYAFVDQDDVWHEDKLRRAIAYLTTVPPDKPNLFCSNSNLINGDGEKIGLYKTMRPYYTKGNTIIYPIIQGCSMVFNRKALEIYFYSMNNLAYHDRWMYHICTFLGNTYYEHEPLFDYRIHGSNALGIKKKKTAISYLSSLYKTIFIKKESIYFPWVKDFYNTFEKRLSDNDKNIILTYLNYKQKFTCKYLLLIKKEYYPTERTISNILFHILHAIFNKL